MSKDYEELLKLYDEYKYRCESADLDGFMGYVKMTLKKTIEENAEIAHYCGNCEHGILDTLADGYTCGKEMYLYLHGTNHECHIEGGFKEKQSENKPP